MTEEQAERLIEALQNIQSEMENQSKDISYIGAALSEIDFQLKTM